MSSNLVIKTDDLGKMYTLYSHPQDRLKQSLLGRFGKIYGHSFWALNHISFEVRTGETFGIIGRNGSGKSTLLQILAGTLTATTGKINIHGRVSALLELGSGFNPEFTGRENVYLNGMILGISRDEMDERFDEIAAFADIGEFIDQPVKSYSSGMFVRLAFSVAAGVDADIMLVDEALAVGDIFFRQKCYQRLENLRNQGTSILLVSHAMNEIEQFCDRALLLNEGQSIFLGDAVEAVKRYYLVQQGVTLKSDQASQPLNTSSYKHANYQTDTIIEDTPSNLVIDWPEANAFIRDISFIPQIGNNWAKIIGISVTNTLGKAVRVFQQGETACFWYDIEVLHELNVPNIGTELTNDRGIIVHGKTTIEYGSMLPSRVKKGSHLHICQEISLNLAAGEYVFGMGMSCISFEDYQQRALLTHEELYSRMTVICNLPAAGTLMIVMRRHGTPVQLMHHGIANLPGNSHVTVVE